ncbi:MAG TPA: BadF/BadG/BcrA/BcrD ATPase family protein [Candidatus Acidoferrum sp.]|nr:BadF/BadG/BcrA/BcrD ATPase family protein [Candidatus Acidoferrum sp.]
MRFVLGFDGGGTKTDCVLMDESGAILARSQAGPSNPLRIGFGAAISSIREAARAAISQAKVPGESTAAALCAGLAGAGPPESAEKIRALLAAEFPESKVQVCTDLDLALAAAGDGPAIVLLAGTGSFAVGRNTAGETARAGGYGSQIGDEGSAYDIGRRAVLTVMHENDRTGEDALLGQRVLREVACANWSEVKARAQAASDEVFPRLFAVVATVADWVETSSESSSETAARNSAQGILRAAAFDLAALAETLAERLHLQGTRFDIAKTGGMIGRSNYLESQLDERLRDAFPLAAIGMLRVSPAEAAARKALQLLSSDNARAENPMNGNAASGKETSGDATGR